MRVYRLAKKKYCKDLSGVGAELNGGRWNSVGTRMVYTSSSRALACLEVAVHLKLNREPKKYYIITLEISENLITRLDPTFLKGRKWDEYPPIGFTQKLGDDFIMKNENAVLQVPSAVVEDEYNYLFNPMREDFHTISIKDVQPFRWDKRHFEP